MLGQTLDGRYRLLEQIGTGGMSGVYRACQINVGRDVAVKILSSMMLPSPQAGARFEMEARIISGLRHPNTLKMIDFGRLADGRTFLVTEFLQGSTLEKELSSGPLDPTWTLVILRQVLDSMTEAHERHIVHRDLKPANIILEQVGDDRIVKVIDFGIAKLAGAQTHITAVGAVCGTPCYMSPEQAAGDEIDHRSDLYSLGVIAYECLSGRPPFSSPQPTALLFQHINDLPPPLSEVAPSVPPEIAALVMQLLEKDPDKRPANARDVRAQIDRILIKSPINLDALRSTIDTNAMPTPSHGVPPVVIANLTRTQWAARRRLPKVDPTLAFMWDRRLKTLGTAFLAAAIAIATGSWIFLSGGKAEIISVADAEVIVEPLVVETTPMPTHTNTVITAAVAPTAPAPIAPPIVIQETARPARMIKGARAPVPVEQGFVDFSL